MAVQFSGWEVVDDGASFAGVELEPSQKPQNRGVYTMYHGTSVASARLIIANGFKQSSGGMLGRGVYVSRDIKKAAHYPLNSNSTDRVVFKLHVRVGRVKRIDKDNHPMQYTWSTHRYDTAWVPPKCGLKAVRSGLEEDCVFDPKRVKVVGIAKAPDAIIQKELEQLLSKTSSRPGSGGDATADVCSLCKKKSQQGASHIRQQCWECGQNICILMSKHFCPAKPFRLENENDTTDELLFLNSTPCKTKMSLPFFGWEVTYDDDSPRVELVASQAPKDSGVYTMFHGTSIANARLIIANGFQQSSGGMLGKGVYVSRDKKKAERYPLKNALSDRVVLELRVHVGRVKRIDIDNHPMQYTWSTQGYDTAWVPPNCGMKAVPSGLEEDCVFDPKRVKVTSIAKAPDTVLSELQQLLANSLRNTGNAGDGSAVDVCSLCKRKTQQASPHIKQPCWGCGQNICTLMTKHVCPTRP
ncbi:uncharacterized protein LOC116689371 [Etheostoma spectabile]|uniref:uncharacterized protein LOC116689371 n=1 Tax=Etheostoma spectabile TaxID=54343 RepID=UPI0013AFB934|nr:uncharacterized protein LOC116689371 [Etheostoma spectabile]